MKSEDGEDLRFGKRGPVRQRAAAQSEKQIRGARVSPEAFFRFGKTAGRIRTAPAEILKKRG